MKIVLRDVRLGRLGPVTARVPAGAVVGIVGESGSGQVALLDLVAGRSVPEQGIVEAPGRCRWFGPLDSPAFEDLEAAAVCYGLDPLDGFSRAKAARAIESGRRQGLAVMIATEDETLLRGLADEVWWMHEGRLAAQGDPNDVLPRYRSYLASRLRTWGETYPAVVTPMFRRGDGRAELEAIELLGEEGLPTTVWRTGETATVRLSVRFADRVADPVFGIMIRTRVGFEVFGTNTWLEQAATDVFEPGSRALVEFRFSCRLCPQEYTLTAASHDVDGAWHDWLEDAVGFTVSADRYTAGVADLQATVEIRRVDS